MLIRILKTNLIHILIIFINVAFSQNYLKINYHLDISLFPSEGNKPHIIEGINHVSITNNWDKPIGEFHFHNNSNGYYDPNDDRSAQTVIGKIKFPQLEKVVNKDKISMRIDLSQPLSPGDSIQIDIPFTTRISQIPGPFIPTVGTKDDTTIYNLIFFYPILEYFYEDGWHIQSYDGTGDPHSNIAEYSVTMSFPKGYKIGSSGHILSVDTLETGIITQELYYPSQIAFSAALSTIFERKHESVYGIEIDFLHTPGQSSNVDSLLQVIYKIIPFYENLYGKCPNDKITITMGYSLGSNVGALATSSYIIYHNSMKSISILCHEFAHLWFGGGVLADENYDTWMNESFAEYSSRLFLYKRKLGQKILKPEAKFRKFDLWSDIRTFDAERMFFLLHDMLGDDALAPIYEEGVQTDWENYSQLISRYLIGSNALLMLHNSVGDSIMEEILWMYTSENRWKTANTDIFINVVQRVAGSKTAENFYQAITTTDRPDLKIENVKSRLTENGNFLTMVQTDFDGDWLLPVDTQAILETGDTITMKPVWLDENKNIIIDSPSKVRSVKLDSKGKMFDKLRFNNYWPRRIQIQPLFGLPSWDTYKIYFRPHIINDWSGNWRYGLRISGGLGLKLLPIIPSEFRHLFKLDLTFSPDSKYRNWGGKVSYLNPVKFLNSAYWGVNAGFEYPRNSQRLLFKYYIGDPEYYFTNKLQSFKQLTSEITRTEYQHADEKDWWKKGKSIAFQEEFVSFRMSNTDRFLLRVSSMIGKSLGNENNNIFSRICAGIDYKKSFIEKVTIRIRNEYGFIWDKRTSDELRININHVPSFWNQTNNFLTPFRGETDVESTRWNNVLSLGFDLGLKSILIPTPIIFLDGLLVDNHSGSLTDRLNALAQFDPLYLSAGIGYTSNTIIDISIYLPFWISHPPKTSSNWDFRYILQIRANF